MLFAARIRFQSEFVQFFGKSFQCLNGCVQLGLLRLSWLVGVSGGLLGFSENKRRQLFDYAFFAKGFDELWVAV